MKQFDASTPIDHPAILSIAVDLILHPQHRAYYSNGVLAVVDSAIEKIRQCCAGGHPSPRKTAGGSSE